MLIIWVNIHFKEDPLYFRGFSISPSVLYGFGACKWPAKAKIPKFPWSHTGYIDIIYYKIIKCLKKQYIRLSKKETEKSTSHCFLSAESHKCYILSIKLKVKSWRVPLSQQKMSKSRQKVAVKFRVSVGVQSDKSETSSINPVPLQSDTDPCQSPLTLIIYVIMNPGELMSSSTSLCVGVCLCECANLIDQW